MRWSARGALGNPGSGPRGERLATSAVLNRPGVPDLAQQHQTSCVQLELRDGRLLLCRRRAGPPVCDRVPDVGVCLELV